jgi:hypothetical protein
VLSRIGRKNRILPSAIVGLACRAVQAIECLAGTRNSNWRSSARVSVVACLVVLLLAAQTDPGGFRVWADEPHTEFQVKAAYLFNFLKFVEWPEEPGNDPHGAWVVGFVGDSPIGDELAHLVEGKSILGRGLATRRFRDSDDLRSCNILFIAGSQKKRLPAILAALRGSSVLTVADMDDFIGSGGMIQFVMENARVRVAIDVGATSRARLKVSSKLLALAESVTQSARSANN